MAQFVFLNPKLGFFSYWPEVAEFDHPNIIKIYSPVSSHKGLFECQNAGHS